MSLFNNAIIGASGQGGYRISRSVRTRSSASGYFNRSFTTPTSQQKGTFSFWLKRGALGARYNLFSNDNGTQYGYLEFNATDQLNFADPYSAGACSLVTTQVFRDPAAWYHIVIAFDTTQATSTDRAKFYVNGVQITSFGTATYPSQNANLYMLQAGSAVQIAAFTRNGTPTFDGYQTEYNFIDGQALTPNSFGTINSYGVWQPKRYAGTYGTNGFYLNFSDNSNNTATTIGKDYSGNGNNWTPNNISVTAGVTYDSMLDVPTNYSDGGNGRGNYCVLNPLNNTGTTASANLNWNGTDKAILSTIAFPTTGKYYFEATCSTVANFSIIGIANSAIYASAFNGLIASANFRTYNSGGEKADSTRTASWGSTFTNNDIIGVAVDMDNGAIYFAKNNTWQASGVPTSGASKTGAAFTDLTSSGLTWTPFFGATNINGVWIANFGQRPFTYTPPTGFVALNTQNLPTPTISNGAQYMAATTYAGSASTQVINSNMTALDFAWIKNRTTARSHALVDTVRGGSPMWTLFSDLTAAESNTSPNYNPTSISGSSITLGGATLGLNNSGENFVMWGWNAGGSTVTNTSGTISAQVRANATAGFSVVTYTGTGANATVGHGLGVAPKMIIARTRVSAVNWAVGHSSLTSWSNWLVLNLTNAQAANTNAWNGVAPTSTVFTVGTGATTNASGESHVAYCFAAVAGYSAFGSYTGNGSADGVFVYLGFRARFLMIKRTDGLGGWVMLDTSRDPYNIVGNYLYANSSAADAGSSNVLDINSNGFKIRNSWTDINASGGTYVYMAFAENPFKLSLAR